MLSMKSASIGAVSTPAGVAQGRRMISEFNKSYFKVLHLMLLTITLCNVLLPINFLKYFISRCLNAPDQIMG